MVFSIRNLGYSEKELEEFLRESNAIEGKHSDECLHWAKNAWEYLYERDADREMSVAVVRDVHRALMQPRESFDDIHLWPHWAGELRNGDVYIGGKPAMFAKHVIKNLEHWCMEMNKPRDLQPPALEELSKQLHVEYEKIHPFFDGNGRTGRMFMNWWRLKQGLPLLIIHTGEEQWDYYQWFRK